MTNNRLALFRNIQIRQGPIEHLCGERNGFGERWMRMYGEADILRIGAKFHGESDLRDQFAGTGPDNATAEYATAVLIKQQFRKAFVTPE